MSDELKISIAAGVVHILSAAAALVFFIIIKDTALNSTSAAPYLLIFAIMLAFFAVASIFVAAIQFCFGVGIIVTGALRKKKLCALFCGLPLPVDAVAVFCSALLSFELFTNEFNVAAIFLAINLLLLALLSIAGITLSIIAMVKNLSKKPEEITQ